MATSPSPKEVVIVFSGDARGLKKSIDAIDKELGQLVVQTDRVQAELGPGLGKASKQAVASLNNTSAALRRTSKNMNQYSAAQNRAMKTGGQMRANIQNLGFQFQDIAVQAEMGTNAFRILGQQGSQILGIFGPGGAIAGAALAIGAALVAPLMAANEEAESLVGTLEKGLAESAFGGDKVSQEIAAASKMLIEADQAIQRIEQQIEARTRGREGTDYEAQLERLGQATRDNLELNKQTRDEMILRLKILRNMKDVTEALANDQEQELANIKELAEYERQRRLDQEEIDKGAQEQLRIKQQEISLLTIQDQFGKDSVAYMELKKQHSLENLRISLENEKVDEQIVQQLLAAHGVAIDLANEMGRAATNSWDMVAGLSTAVQNRMVEAGIASGSIPGQAAADLPNPVEDSYQQRMEARRKAAEAAAKAAERAANKKGGAGKATDAQKELTKSIEDTMKAMDKQIELADQWGQQWDDILSDTLRDGWNTLWDDLAAGELKFKEFAKNMLRELFKISAQAFVTQTLLASIGVVPGLKASEATGLQSIMGNAFGFNFAAKGMALQGGNVIPFAKGGVVNSPTAFPMSGANVGIMGEAGPEAVMPLSRGSDGKLGVAGPAITINNYSGQEVSVDRTEQVITIAVGRAKAEVKNEFAESMNTGQGVYARSMEGGYNARRKAV